MSKRSQQTAKPVPPVLYHVTPNANVNSIMEFGIDPKRSKGALVVSWYVDFEHIQWALNKMSLKFNVPIGEFVIFEINDITNPDRVVRFNRWALKQGLYTCKEIVKPYVYYKVERKTLEELGVL